MIGEQMEHITKTNKDKQIKRKIEPSPVLEHRLQQVESTCLGRLKRFVQLLGYTDSTL